MREICLKLTTKLPGSTINDFLQNISQELRKETIAITQIGSILQNM